MVSRYLGVGMESEIQINPMHWPMHQATRCKARSKRTGKPCGSPAVRGHRVCRMHGARGGAPSGKRNGLYRHGKCTQELRGAVRYLKAMARLVKSAAEG